MAIYNEEVNEIYPIQTFLKEEMLKDTNILKELDQKKENMDSTSIATTLLIESFKQALSSEEKMRAFKKYFAKYNKRAESIQFSNEQIARNEEASDKTEELLEDTLETNKEIEKEIEESKLDEEKPDNLEANLEIFSPEQIEAFYDALDDIINDESLKDEKTVEKLKKESKVNKTVYNEDQKKDSSLTYDQFVNEKLKENLNVAKERMRELRRTVMPAPKPEFVRAEITEENMKKGLLNAQKDILVLILRNPEYEKPKVFEEKFNQEGEWHKEFRMENFSDDEIKELQDGIYSLEQQARAAVMSSYEKFKDQCSELKKAIFGDANAPTPQPIPEHTDANAPTPKPIPEHTIESSSDGNTKVIMPDKNQSTQSMSNQMINILKNIENMFQQFFSYGQSAPNQSSSVDQTAADTAQTSSTAPIPTPKPWKEEL